MKRKFMALFISLAMIFSSVISVPAKVFAEGVNIPSFADFGLNDTSSVKATWDKGKQTLTVKGNGKIDINKWVELAKKFSANNYKDASDYGWNTNSNFTMDIADNTVKFPDVTVYKKDGATHGFFYSFQGEIKINEEIDTSNVTDMRFMFYYVTKANPDISKWNTSNVTDMSYMFNMTTKANPDVSRWNTSKVTDMAGMFGGATKANPDVSKWDTSKVTNMSGMFSYATNANPDVSKWDTSKVTTMCGMFNYATNANPDVSKWNTSKVTNIISIFASSGVVELDLSNWDISKITENKDAFKDTSKLEFLSFKKLPKEHKLTKFAGKYKVDVDGIIERIEGPFDKDKEYTFNKNTEYRVYLSEKSQRIYGADRYETAVKLSQSLTNGSKKVFIASGISMIDALNVGPYAGRLKAPVLLTKTNEIDAGTLAEIERLKAKEVIIIGGVNAVSENVANQLKAKGLTVNRIFGENRYETALNVAKEAIDNGVLKSNKVFLCSGISPADALSIASAAAKEEGIILLTDGNSLKGAEKYIKSGVEVKIIGGTGVISDKLEQELSSMGATVERISGNDRYETSVKVYEKYYKPMGVKSIYLANGLTMADALTGAGVAYNFGTGLLLTSANEMINPMKEIIKEIKTLKVLGGNAVVNDNIWE